MSILHAASLNINNSRDLVQKFAKFGEHNLVMFLYLPNKHMVSNLIDI